MSDYNLACIVNSNNFLKNIIYYEEITSTNSVAKKILNKTNLHINNFLVLADYQTNGRGKGDAYYFSPAKVGIYMSVVLIKPSYDLKLLSMATSLAIAKSLCTFIDANIKIKWPNDILINNKKVCGILIESATQAKSATVDYTIIGVGININNKNFDSEIESIATSLSKECGKTIDRNMIIVKILNLLENLLSKTPQELFDEYLLNLDEKSLDRISQCNIF